MSDGSPIKPRVLDARAYEKALRRGVLAPMLKAASTRIEGAGANYVAIREAIRNIPSDPNLSAVATNGARATFMQANKWHRARFTKTMRRFFGVRIDLLRDTPIDLEARVRENVNLIRTIPERFHTGLAQKIEAIQTDKPFDQQKLRNVLRKEYKSSTFNAKRIARDQTSKLTGQLNQARQTEVGVDSYTWQTSEDERVRPEHSDNNGQVFAWNSPPPATGHPGEDVQCRCVAVAVIRPPASAPIQQPNVQPTGAVPIEGEVVGTNLVVDRELPRYIFRHVGMKDYKARERVSRASDAYFGKAYRETNNALRTGRRLDDPALRGRLEGIRGDMTPLTQNVRVYRGVDKPLDMRAGQIIEEQGFVSASTNPNLAARDFAAGETLFQFTAPKGTRALVSNARESEILFNSGMKFRVVRRIDDFEYTSVSGMPSTRSVKRFYELEVMP